MGSRCGLKKTPGAAIMGLDFHERTKKKPQGLCGAMRFYVVPEAGLEPARCFAPADFESAASTYFATPANRCECTIMAHYSL